MTYSIRSYRPLRPRAPRLLPGQALVRARRTVRPMLRPIPTADPIQHQAQQETWLSGRTARFHRRKITSRIVLAVSVATMILALFFASTQSINPLESAQTAQLASSTTQVESMQPLLAVDAPARPSRTQ